MRSKEPWLTPEKYLLLKESRKTGGGEASRGDSDRTGGRHGRKPSRMCGVEPRRSMFFKVDTESN